MGWIHDGTISRLLVPGAPRWIVVAAALAFKGSRCAPRPLRYSGPTSNWRHYQTRMQGKRRYTSSLTVLLVAVSTYYICNVVVVEVVAYYTCMFVSVADVIYTTIK